MGWTVTGWRQWRRWSTLVVSTALVTTATLVDVGSAAAECASSACFDQRTLAVGEGDGALTAAVTVEPSELERTFVIRAVLAPSAVGAADASDLVGVSGGGVPDVSVAVAPGRTGVEVTYPIFDDATPEPDETFMLQVVDPDGSVLDTIEVTIVDDDSIDDTVALVAETDPADLEPAPEGSDTTGATPPDEPHHDEPGNSEPPMDDPPPAVTSDELDPASTDPADLPPWEPEASFQTGGLTEFLTLPPPTIGTPGPSTISPAGTCTRIWDGPTTGSAGVASHWAPDGVPGPTDVACVGPGVTVTVASPTALTVGGLWVQGVLSMSSGSIDLQGLGVVNDLRVSGGRITGTGDLGIGPGGVVNWTGGTVDGSGAFVLAGSAAAPVSATISGFGSRTLVRDLTATDAVVSVGGDLLVGAATITAG
ncbi:MAG TPA: hypothetical protein VK853_08865, partial [Ilumatobacteraceae bacterium]|nr:hypothetical protein [Ilumatobacteraceae bacterium]